VSQILAVSWLDVVSIGGILFPPAVYPVEEDFFGGRFCDQIQHRPKEQPTKQAVSSPNREKSNGAK
jgi:hypothetical protein